MKKLYGVVVPTITPLTEDDRIDVESLETLCEHLIQKGVDCLYPNGTTGEMVCLTLEERKLIAETVVKTAAGRLPVFVQVGAWNERDTLELARHAVDIGADGLGIVTPVFFKLSDDALFEFYRNVADAMPADCPIYLYAIPQNAVNDITPALAARIAESCPNVVGIKYSYPNMPRIQQMMTIRGGDFSVLVGPDELFTLTVCAGGDGTVSGNAQCIPEHYAAIQKALKAKDYEQAAKIQRRTNVLNGILSEYDNIAHYKAVLHAEGIIKTKKMRRPMAELPDGAAEKLMETLGGLEYHKVLI